MANHHDWCIRAGVAVALARLGTAAPVFAQDCWRWSGSIGQPGADLTIDALAHVNDGAGRNLIVGGQFTTVDGQIVNGIAQWNGADWSPLDGPFGVGVGGDSPVVYALAEFDDGTGPALFAGGVFTVAGGVVANRIAKWNGTGWAPLGPGVDHHVNGLAVFDDGAGPALFAGGNFKTAGGVTVNHVARWNGAAWTALSGPFGTGVGDAFGGSVRAFAVFDDGSGPALYVGGGFTKAGGVEAYNVAKWDGVEWSALGTGTNGFVAALAVFDDGLGPALFAGGFFSSAGDKTAHHIAKWDGAEWHPLSPTGQGTSGPVLALKTFNQGVGPRLFAAGSFIKAGNVVVNHIASWDGNAWMPLSGPQGHGVGGGGYLAIHALTDFLADGEAVLIAGGSFSTAGGLTANCIAQWERRPPCRPDVNDDCAVDTNDVLQYLNLWASGDARADWNTDDVVNTIDFLAFLNEWVIGC
ncbi:MAG: hypothetical protein KIS87_11075 [Phycisphaeraceae bacterium]|nr:hypothetical protein [Phycisphaeraceae bacterium]